MLFYLASPYTHDNPHVQDDREQQARFVTALLTNADYTVIAPIPYYCSLAKLHPNLPTTYAAYKMHNERIMRKCDEMLVLTLGGWRESVGVQAEIDFWARQTVPGLELLYANNDPIYLTVENCVSEMNERYR